MDEQNKVFHENFRFRLINEMGLKGLKAVDLCERTGIPKAAMSLYINGRSLPKQDRVYIIAEAIGVNPVWLMGFDVDKYIAPEKNSEEESYYLDDRSASIAMELKENKELALLFDAARDASAEDLKAVHAMLLALKRKDNK